MQDKLSFDIKRKSEIEETFRVSKIIGQFDLKLEHSNEHFVGEITLPQEWNKNGKPSKCG